MTFTYAETFNRADGPLGSPWVNVVGDTAIVSGQLSIVNGAADFPMANRTLVSLVFSVVSIGTGDVPFVSLWSGSGATAGVFASLSTNQIVFDLLGGYGLAYRLSGYVPGSDVITSGSTVKAVLSDAGQLSIRVNSVMQYNANLWETAHTEYPSVTLTSWPQENISFYSGGSSPVVIDDVTIVYNEATPILDESLRDRRVEFYGHGI